METQPWHADDRLCMVGLPGIWAEIWQTKERPIRFTTLNATHSPAAFSSSQTRSLRTTTPNRCPCLSAGDRAEDQHGWEPVSLRIIYRRTPVYAVINSATRVRPILKSDRGCSRWCIALGGCPNRTRQTSATVASCSSRHRREISN